MHKAKETEPKTVWNHLIADWGDKAMILERFSAEMFGTSTVWLRFSTFSAESETIHGSSYLSTHNVYLERCLALLLLIGSFGGFSKTASAPIFFTKNDSYERLF